MPTVLGLLSLLPAAQAVTWRTTSEVAQPIGSHGEEQWSLYPKWKAPPGRMMVKTLPEEHYGPVDKGPMGDHCYPGGLARGNFYHHVATPTLVPYWVKPGEHPHRQDAAVLVVPGGGKDFVEFEKTGTDMAKWLNSIGISAFVLKYRVNSGAYVEGEDVSEYDVQRGMSWIRDANKELFVNTSKVGILASGKGADLALRAVMALQRGYPEIDYVDERRFSADFALLVSPLIYPETAAAMKRSTATFITMAHDDQCSAVPQVLNFFTRDLRMMKAPPSEIHIYDKGGHGYGTCNLYPELASLEACTWTKKAEEFLQRRLAALSDRSVVHHQVKLAREAPKPLWCPPMDATFSTCYDDKTCTGNCDMICWEHCVLNK